MKTTRFLAGPPEICAHLGIGAQTTGRSGRNLSRRPACLQFGEQPILFAGQGFVSALFLLVHIHMDDALVPRALALKRVAVALKARVPVEERRDGRIVLGRKFEPEDLAVVGDVAAVAHADDGAGDARAWSRCRRQVRPLLRFKCVTSIPKELPDAGLDAAAVEDGESVADESEEGANDLAQRLGRGYCFGCLVSKIAPRT